MNYQDQFVINDDNGELHVGEGQAVEDEDRSEVRDVNADAYEVENEEEDIVLNDISEDEEGREKKQEIEGGGVAEPDTTEEVDQTSEGSSSIENEGSSSIENESSFEGSEVEIETEADSELDVDDKSEIQMTNPHSESSVGRHHGMKTIEMNNSQITTRSDVQLPAKRQSEIPTEVFTDFMDWGFEPIHVNVRIRPLSNEDFLLDSIPFFCPSAAPISSSVLINTDVDVSSLPIKIGDAYNRLKAQIGTKSYDFSGNVFDSESTNSFLYERTIRSSVIASTEGVNTAILAIGDVNSGKSCTFLGSASQPGIIAQAISDLYAHIESYANFEDNAFTGINTPNPGLTRPLVAEALHTAMSASKKRHVLRIQFCIRMAFIDIFHNEVRDLLPLLFDSENMSLDEITEPMMPYPGSVLQIVDDLAGDPFGPTIQIQGLQWLSLSTIDAALALFSKILNFRYSQYTSRATPTAIRDLGDFVVFINVERIVVEFIRPKSRHTGSQSMATTQFFVKERSEGSLCFVVPSKDPAAVGDGKSGVYFLNQVLALLDKKGNIRNERDAILLAERSALTKILSPYLFNHGRLVAFLTMNPGLDWVSRNLIYLENVSALSKIKRHIKSAHTAWSQSSYYCTKVWDPIQKYHFSLKYLKGAEARKQQAEITQKIFALMSRISEAGVQPWSKLVHRRLIPIFYWYSQARLIDLADDTGHLGLQLFEKEEAKEVKTKRSDKKAKTPVHPLVTKELRRLREAQEELAKKVKDYGKLKKELIKEKQKELTLAAKVDRALSLPEYSAEFPSEDKPKFDASGRLSEPLLPFKEEKENVSSITQPSEIRLSPGGAFHKTTSNLRYKSQYKGSPQYQGEAWTGTETIPWQSVVQPRYTGKTMEVKSRPWETEAQYKQAAQSYRPSQLPQYKGGAFDIEPELATSPAPAPLLSYRPRDNPIHHFLGELIDRCRDSSLSGETSSSTSHRKRRKSRKRLSQKPKERKMDYGTGRQKRSKEKSKNEGKENRHRKEDVSSCTLKKGRGRNGDDSSSVSTSSESSTTVQAEPKRPTIQAAGGLRIDADGSAGVAGAGQPTFFPSVMGAGFSNGAGLFGPQAMGGVGIGGGYPYGSLGFLSQDGGRVSLKPTLEHHLSPAAMTPFATFKYPEAQQEAKPIVVHLHQHGKDTKKEIPLVVEKPDERTEEGQNVSIATAATLRHLMEKEEKKQKTEVPPFSAFSQAPAGSLPWGTQPGFQGYVPMSQQPPSPSSFKLGFEGALNMDPALLGKRRKKSTSLSSSSDVSRRKRRGKTPQHYAKKKRQLGKKKESKSSAESTSSVTRSKRKGSRRERDVRNTRQHSKRRKEYKSPVYSSSYKSSETDKPRKEAFREERRRLVRKLMQQLYYYPDASGAVAERTLQDVLPLLQPFERQKLIRTIGEYRTALGQAPLGPNPFGGNSKETKAQSDWQVPVTLSYDLSGAYTSYANESDRRQPSDTFRKTGRRLNLLDERERSQPPLSHMSSESTPSLSDLETSQLIRRIRDTNLVERKRRRAVLRGEAGNRIDRYKAVQAAKLHRELRQLDTSDLLKQTKAADLDIDRDIFEFEQDKAKHLHQRTLPRERQQSEVSAGRLSVSSAPSDQSFDKPELRRTKSKGANYYSGSLQADDRSANLLKEPDIGQRSRRLHSDIRPNSKAFTGLSYRDEILDSNNLGSSLEKMEISSSEAAKYAQKMEDAPVVESLHRESQKLQQEIGDLITSFANINQAPKISVSEVPQQQLSEAKTKGSAHSSGHRRSSLLEIPVPGSTPPSRRGVNLAQTSPESPIKMEVAGLATVEGDASLFSQMRQVMGVGSPPPQPTNLSLSPLPFQPAVFGYPQGLPTFRPDGTSIYRDPQFGVAEEASPTYTAEIRMPKDDEKKAAELPSINFLPPPKRRQIPPDAGSPIPLSSLMWGGADNTAEKIAQTASHYPSNQPHFNKVSRGRSEGPGPTNERYEVPVKGWERIGMLAGAEDLPEDQHLFRTSLRPWLEEPWRVRVNKTFQKMMQKSEEKKREGKNIDPTIIRSSADQSSQIRKLLQENRALLQFERVGCTDEDSAPESHFESSQLNQNESRSSSTRESQLNNLINLDEEAEHTAHAHIHDAPDVKTAQFEPEVVDRVPQLARDNSVKIDTFPLKSGSEDNALSEDKFVGEIELATKPSATSWDISTATMTKRSKSESAPSDTHIQTSKASDDKISTENLHVHQDVRPVQRPSPSKLNACATKGRSELSSDVVISLEGKDDRSNEYSSRISNVLSPHQHFVNNTTWHTTKNRTTYPMNQAKTVVSAKLLTSMNVPKNKAGSPTLQNNSLTNKQTSQQMNYNLRSQDQERSQPQFYSKTSLCVDDFSMDKLKRVPILAPTRLYPMIQKRSKNQKSLSPGPFKRKKPIHCQLRKRELLFHYPLHLVSKQAINKNLFLKTMSTNETNINDVPLQASTHATNGLIKVPLKKVPHVFASRVRRYSPTPPNCQHTQTIC